MGALAEKNAARWAKAHITRNALPVAQRLVAAKARYQAVSAKTGVPWFVIAVIHQRESSQNWRGSLAQGDPWDRASVHVPRGRGPFKSWEDAAIDALTNCAPFLARRKDWSLGATLQALEEYNGVGYAKRGIPSPYVWAGTDQYRAGKYVADGKFDPNHVDQQLGCAAMILAMMTLDHTITFGNVALTPSTDKPQPKPSVIKNTTGSGTAGAGAATAAHQSGLSIGWVIGIGVAVAIAAFLIIHFWPRKP